MSRGIPRFLLICVPALLAGGAVTALGRPWLLLPLKEVAELVADMTGNLVDGTFGS